MGHTPYGYDIVDGKIVVNEEQAKILRQICDNYLDGMSLVKAAASAGLSMRHASLKYLISHPRYLGDGFYPPILTEETVRQFENERIRREKEWGHKRWKREGIPMGTVYSYFSAPNLKKKYMDPVKQAEYSYSCIRNKESK